MHSGQTLSVRTATASVAVGAASRVSCSISGNATRMAVPSVASTVRDVRLVPYARYRTSSEAPLVRLSAMPCRVSTLLVCSMSDFISVAYATSLIDVGSVLLYLSFPDGFDNLYISYLCYYLLSGMGHGHPPGRTGLPS
jgi:hypothetical protein